MLHTFIGDLGHLFVITAFVTSVVAAFAYYKATSTKLSINKEQWLNNARIAFYIHTISVVGIVVTLFLIIKNGYYEYHYAWSHSSKHLPAEYMISSFWEGQEGSFMLWMFWQALLGIVLIKTNKFWESPLMTIFSLVQAFLASMILGVVIFNFKIGSTPFLLLRDVMDAPIFKINPEFIPEDGTGLNPLLQNYWMVIHPPTLFLGFATTLIPFSFCISGLWIKKYHEWIRPALPWAIFSAAVLGLGILMGGYWAYETLNFGGYWNWDPVENAVYVPWLFLIACIHTMITFRNSNTALKTSIILVITTFVLILYSTFLTRSGVLGEASVHSFTDLGLSGQLLIYLLFFTFGAIVLASINWKKIPSSNDEVSTYSREFWIFVGAATLGLMGFQVLVPTSIPVFNKIVQLFGGVSNAALPADQIGFFTMWQKWFAIIIALLSGTGQFFWWKKMDRSKLLKELTTPLILTLLISSVIFMISGVTNPSYLILLTAGLYSIIANGKILIQVSKKNVNLSGGSISHIGIAMILIGIMFSSGHSNVISLNSSGMPYNREFPDQMNKENLLLFLNEPKNLKDYQVTYSGKRSKIKGLPGYLEFNKFGVTNDPYQVIANQDIISNGHQYFTKGDTMEIEPENIYHEVKYKKNDGSQFVLYPRVQFNPNMGTMVSPDIKRTLSKDIYTHITNIPDPDVEKEWGEIREIKTVVGQEFFVNDFVATIEGIERLTEVDNVTLTGNDVAIKAKIKILGKARDYFSEPIFMIKDNMIGRIPYANEDIGVKLTLLNVHPEDNSFSIGINQTQKDWIILEAVEKPWINILWSGTFLLMIGFGIATYRRFGEFSKIRDKNLE